MKVNKTEWMSEHTVDSKKREATIKFVEGVLAGLREGSIVSLAIAASNEETMAMTLYVFPDDRGNLEWALDCLKRRMNASEAECAREDAKDETQTVRSAH